MKCPSLLVMAACALLVLCQGCANPHCFPKLREPFAGFDESNTPTGARGALEKARIDFQLARQGRPPQFARPVSAIACNSSQHYRGHGYTLTLFNDDTRVGPAISLDSFITGGDPYHYDEVDAWDD